MQKKIRIPLLAILGCAILYGANSLKALANSSNTCEFQDTTIGNTDLQSIPRGNDCIILITPSDPGEKYRDYSFSSKGIFLVFNTFSSTGSNSSSTGARAYFIFPRTQNPTFSALPNGDILVQDASGKSIRFSSAATKLESISGIEFNEDPQVNKNNNGGIDITAQDTLILDTGFQLGAEGYTFPNRTSTFHDPSGETCVVKNKEIFDYVGYDANLKFPTDLDLANFLSTRCPNLNLDSLRK